MNKKLMPAFASTFIGIIALTATASASELNLGASLKSNIHFAEKLEHRLAQNEKKEEKRENKITSSTTTEAQKMTTLKARANKEIDSRISSLNAFNVKMQALANITVANKAAIAVNVQSQIATLTALKAKINAGTNLATLKADVASITKPYKNFGLTIPKANLVAKVESHFSALTKLASTTAALLVDIQTAQTAGKDVTTLRTKLADANAKLADANVQSNAALTIITPLIPSMGSSTALLANKQALTDAYAKYKLAMTDIKTVKTYIKDIVNQLRDWNVTVTANTDVKTGNKSH